MNYRITPLVERFKDPFYYVFVHINLHGTEISGIVTFEHDRIIGKFDFGDLKEMILGLPNLYQNTLKTNIKKAIFEQKEFANSV